MRKNTDNGPSRHQLTERRITPLAERLCEYCHKPYLTPSPNTSRYCSNVCRSAAYRKRHTANCASCGNAIDPGSPAFYSRPAPAEAVEAMRSLIQYMPGSTATDADHREWQERVTGAWLEIEMQSNWRTDTRQLNAPSLNHRTISPPDGYLPFGDLSD